MKLIVAVDKRWAIGYRGQMLFQLPKDLHFFKEQTIGNVVISGRSTLKTYPNGEPLANRVNIILSHYPNLNIPNAIVSTIQQLPSVLQPYLEAGQEVFVAGGGSVYRQLLPYSSHAIVTYVDAAMEQVDTYFPNLSEMVNWRLEHQTEPIKEAGYTYRYRYYINDAVLPLQHLEWSE